ncbi:hypothetical protein FPV67DRAFT_1667118 [Lyophyllum atratum]|nr:hypothetical protein FPV67DRAFT_1667118 [Lyophyllum atratum]
MSYLPREIIHLIIDPFRDDPHTLAQCSTVCRSWAPRSRALLFQNITVDWETSSARHRIISLQKHLSRNHDLAHLIRSFEVQNLRWKSTSKLAHSTLRALGQIFRLLHQVRQLSLQDVRWFCFPRHLKLAFSELLKRPSVEELHLVKFVISNQSTLLSFITCPPKLKTLHLKDVAVTDLQRDAQPSRTIFRRIYLAITCQLNDDINSTACLIEDARYDGGLEQLHYANRSDLFPIVGCLLQPEFSRRLRMTRSLDILAQTPPELVRRLLNIMSSSLEHLKISSDIHYSETDLAGGEVHLKNLPCLKTLELSRWMPLSGIIRVLSDLGPSSHPLEKIRLSHRQGDNGWGIVDDCLTQYALGNLRCVELVFHDTWFHGETELTSDQFPKLRDRGILVICRT